MLVFKEILLNLGERVSSFNFTSLEPKMSGLSYCDTFTKICFECVLSPQQQKVPKNKQTTKLQNHFVFNIPDFHNRSELQSLVCVLIGLCLCLA